MSECNWPKIKHIISNTLSLNFWHLKTIHILHPHYHPEIMGNILIFRKYSDEYEIKMKMKKHHIDTK